MCLPLLNSWRRFLTIFLHYYIILSQHPVLFLASIDAFVVCCFIVFWYLGNLSDFYFNACSIICIALLWFFVLDPCVEFLFLLLHGFLTFSSFLDFQYFPAKPLCRPHIYRCCLQVLSSKLSNYLYYSINYKVIINIDSNINY